ncbi:TetR/AcrR family transcriptional regulator [Mycobacterium branderi]|uniref:TetR family transcriptional regulator n=1 Tax=Mycobacterium branderi TaxID=43348 RepID=A0A7I7W6S4_9MYCO|nr:TetR/AcrR family transcriptional regulator [Mycobacterium branderi]MCV7231929.1 TetR/AcrR family transcriptional regulator [Mycobacterium branderi]ORA34776.1 TetR family transcriptional regulator [Mycobacterium branderi]BBZ12535.1 putative transcriptional regulator, TetR family protein [Mycobacterium branderi]
MRRNTASSSAQEDAILKAAAEEVALVGVGRASLDVIARQAGVSRSTLYRRFPSRDALITELGRRTFEFAMARLRTVAMDSGPKDAAVAAFCEGLRLLTTEPVMRKFLRLDGDAWSVAGAYEEAEAFLEQASRAMAKALRAAGATMPDDELVAVAELHIRLAGSLAQVPSKVLDAGDDDAVRAYARKHLAPLVW